ncbi:ChaN family lipoprotein [Sulfitobacter sp. JB4-11]|uniref:ChaN family lipoprotein n=1 Tax=Sulfitobacter rhodophyticola TaxID=3238304 RepID=UPI0035162DA5
MKRCAALLLGLTLALPAAADPPLPDTATLEAMAAADVVLIGETHDNGAHHAGQAALIRALDPAAVVFEMLNPEQAAMVEADEGDVSTLGTRIGWDQAGWPDFALYQPIFEALGDAKVVGMALPRDTVRAAFADGAAAVFGAGADDYGLTDPLPDAEQKAREQMQFDAHCEAMPLEMMPGMVEAQRLRDAHFARVTLQALADHGAPVVVILGNGHVRTDWGMPVYLERIAPDVRRFAFAFVEGPQNGTAFDGAMTTLVPRRDDPCAAFSN